MIDKVEMIDKYNSNPLLKNLSNTTNQAMNLRLKNPKKLKAFGNIKTGAGLKDKYNLNLSLLIRLVAQPKLPQKYFKSLKYLFFMEKNRFFMNSKL